MIHHLLVIFLNLNFAIDFLTNRFKIISLINLNHSFHFINHFIAHHLGLSFPHFKITLVAKILTGQDLDTFD